MSTVIAAGRSTDLGTTLEAMADTLASETRLLTELAGLLRRQRAAVASDDLGKVEETVFSTHRILVTLGEARRRRRSLDQLLRAARQDDPAHGPLREAYEALHQTALALSDEVEVSRDVLRHALYTSEEHIRTLRVGSDVKLFYDNSAASAPLGQGTEGALLRKRA